MVDQEEAALAGAEALAADRAAEASVAVASVVDLDREAHTSVIADLFSEAGITDRTTVADVWAGFLEL